LREDIVMVMRGQGEIDEEYCNRLLSAPPRSAIDLAALADQSRDLGERLRAACDLVRGTITDKSGPKLGHVAHRRVIAILDPIFCKVMGREPARSFHQPFKLRSFPIFVLAVCEAIDGRIVDNPERADDITLGCAWEKLSESQVADRVREYLDARV
jgi:hypothetical protein